MKWCLWLSITTAVAILGSLLFLGGRVPDRAYIAAMSFAVVMLNLYCIKKVVHARS